MMYDITQEYFSGRVYPGDPGPMCKRLKSFDAGDLSTVSEVTMQVHAATHIDAPVPFGGCDGAPCRAVLWTKE